MSAFHCLNNISLLDQRKHPFSRKNGGYHSGVDITKLCNSIAESKKIAMIEMVKKIDKWR